MGVSTAGGGNRGRSVCVHRDLVGRVMDNELPEGFAIALMLVALAAIAAVSLASLVAGMM